MKLYVSQPKEKWLHENMETGDVSVHGGIAMFFDGQRLVAQMERVQMIRFDCNILALSGFEECGHDKQGKRKFRYQEWYVHYK